MNKSDFITYISNKHTITKIESEKIIESKVNNSVGEKRKLQINMNIHVQK